MLSGQYQKNTQEQEDFRRSFKKEIHHRYPGVDLGFVNFCHRSLVSHGSNIHSMPFVTSLHATLG